MLLLPELPLRGADGQRPRREESVRWRRRLCWLRDVREPAMLDLLIHADAHAIASSALNAPTRSASSRPIRGRRPIPRRRPATLASRPISSRALSASGTRRRSALPLRSRRAYRRTCRRPRMTSRRSSRRSTTSRTTSSRSSRLARRRLRRRRRRGRSAMRGTDRSSGSVAARGHRRRRRGTSWRRTRRRIRRSRRRGARMRGSSSCAISPRSMMLCRSTSAPSERGTRTSARGAPQLAAFV